MQAALLPTNERQRLDALRRYSVLDTLPEQAYDDITKIASQICGTPIALVSLVDEDRQWFKSRVGLDATETPRDLAFCAHAILEPAQVFTVPDASVDPRFADNPLVVSDPSIRFYAGAPLVTPDGEALGTLCVIDRVAREITPDEERALKALARQVMSLLQLGKAVSDLETAAEERRRYEERLTEYQHRLELMLAQVSEQSMTDSLTGARNRLAFLERLEDEVRRYQRYRTPVALAMIDVDRFKAFNDRFGHPAGDAALREVVRLLSEKARATDVVARYGGEEFALILPNTAADGAFVVAERFRRAIAVAGGPLGDLTVSVGIAEIGPECVDADALIAAADRALYEAKNAGRNRVTCREAA